MMGLEALKSRMQAGGTNPMDTCAIIHTAGAAVSKPSRGAKCICLFGSLAPGALGYTAACRLPQQLPKRSGLQVLGQQCSTSYMFGCHRHADMSLVVPAGLMPHRDRFSEAMRPAESCDNNS